jgi:aminopeptidase N
MKLRPILVLLVFVALQLNAQIDLQKSRDIDFDLLHTELQIKPIWENQTVEGKAKLLLRPYFYAQGKLLLNAKGFKIKSLRVNKVETNFKYDSEIVSVDLPKLVEPKDTLTLEMDYLAQPNLLKTSGSEAITNDKGFYFINPLKTEEGKMRQFWTQGETQANSCWFPTIDTPNQNHTQDIYLTVEKNLTTLSNGILVKSVQNSDQTKTDHWRQSIPHAVYLTMVAGGDFKKVIDPASNDFEISYYLEPEYEKHALGIFGRTPEMIKFFENKLGVKYKWQKYAQIPVRNYVSGAMENTTATVHSKTLLKNHRQLIDGNDDGVIAHELFHHWFGNLVTCESWSHLPLNESFANYSEFLWATHKYGKDEGDYVNLTALQDYLYEATQKQVPMVRFDYVSREDMFDAHSYQKGGRILHQLRLEVGDDAFFKTLKYYLNKYELQTAEIQDLRLAFEKTTGKDLKWFFDQWFFIPGHPRLLVEKRVQKNRLELTVSQIIDSTNSHVYQLKLPIVINSGNNKNAIQLSLSKQSEVFSIDLSGDFQNVTVNPDGYFLGQIEHKESEDELIRKYYNSDQIYARISALETLTIVDPEGVSNPPLQNKKIRTVILDALKDDFWRIRQLAVQKLFNYDGDDFLSVEKALQNTIKNDSKGTVRADAILAVKNFLNPQNDILFRNALNDSSYLNNAAALEALFTNNVEDSEELAKKFANVEDINIFASVGNYLASKAEPPNYDWFINKLSKMEGYEIYQNIGIFGAYLSKTSIETKEKALPFLENLAINSSEWFVRVSSAQILQLLSEDSEKAKKILGIVIEKEKDPRLIGYYQQFKK